MTNSAIALIKQRISANLFDRSHELADPEIEELTRLAARAPTAYNLQNWRVIAARTREAKTRLRGLAYDQAKVSDAAATFIICGELPDHIAIPQRLSAFVEAGFMRMDTASDWRDRARAQYTDPQNARDEAVRSASLVAATLIFAAEALGLASSPMGGFDVEGVAREFDLGQNELPVMLVAVGRAAPGNWPQKPRRPLSEVLKFS